MAWHVQVKNGGVESGKVEAHLIVSDEGNNQHWPANTSSAHWNASAGHVVDTTAVTHDTVKMEFEPLIVNGSDASHSVLTIGPLDFYTAADSEAYYSVAVTGYSIFDGSSSTAHQWRGSVQQRPCLGVVEHAIARSSSAKTRSPAAPVSPAWPFTLAPSPAPAANRSGAAPVSPA